MEWTELEQIIEGTVSKIRFALLDNKSDGVSTALENVKALCDYMFADGKIDIDKDICRIYGYAKELHTNTISYINSNDDIKRVLYEDSKAELETEPASLKELAEKLVRIECDAIIIAKTISQYFTRRGKPLEPQHKPIAAPQQASDGSDGELAGSGNETPPEVNTGDIGCNDDNSDNYIQLPLSMQTADKRAEKIFKAAADAEWMTIVDENSAIWHGFVKTKQGNIKCKEISLAYLVHETYNGCNGLWATIESYFNIPELSKHWGYIKNNQRQQWQNDIDKLISKAIKTSQK